MNLNADFFAYTQALVSQNERLKTISRYIYTRTIIFLKRVSCSQHSLKLNFPAPAPWIVRLQVHNTSSSCFSILILLLLFNFWFYYLHKYYCLIKKLTTKDRHFCLYALRDKVYLFEFAKHLSANIFILL